MKIHINSGGPSIVPEKVILEKGDIMAEFPSQSSLQQSLFGGCVINKSLAHPPFFILNFNVE